MPIAEVSLAGEGGGTREFAASVANACVSGVQSAG